MMNDDNTRFRGMVSFLMCEELVNFVDYYIYNQIKLRKKVNLFTVVEAIKNYQNRGPKNEERDYEALSNLYLELLGELGRNQRKSKPISTTRLFMRAHSLSLAEFRNVLNVLRVKGLHFVA